MCDVRIQSSDWCVLCVFFFNDTATTEIYTLSLHDALPICGQLHLVPEGPVSVLAIGVCRGSCMSERAAGEVLVSEDAGHAPLRSEEHTSELQSRQYLVCRLLLEKKITNSACYCSTTTPS